MSDDLLVDFSDEVEPEITIYKLDGRPIKYDDQTEEYYRVMRERKLDPISAINVDSAWGFNYDYQWDPYTGDKLCIDPVGPLWFDPDSLIYSIYVKRLTLLWNDAVEGDDGTYEGYYGDGIGSGEDMFVTSRGSNTHLYPFRLPIIDCYLTKDHNLALITMGPKLTDEDVKLIDKLAAKKGKTYEETFGRKRPSLQLMKKLYDTAISVTPLIEEYKDKPLEFAKLGAEKIRALRYKANTAAVNSLKKM
jgi:hypothetical protein